MTVKPISRLGAAFAFAVLLSACDMGVVVYEPDVYKGDTDPLASQQAAAERSDALADRAGSAFADR